LKYRNHSSK